MISLYTILTFTFFHWLFDFFLQTKEQAEGKSKSNFWLHKHVQTYTLGLLVMGTLNWAYFKFDWSMLILWVLFNGGMHFLTDYVSSRASSLLFKEDNYHDGFVVIGADQLVHYTTLFSSFYLIQTYLIK